MYHVEPSTQVFQSYYFHFLILLFYSFLFRPFGDNIQTEICQRNLGLSNGLSRSKIFSEFQQKYR